MLARKPDGKLQPRLIPSDKDPNAFHITHPKNSLEGNVAVASEGRGFHFVFPVEPHGDKPYLNGLKPGDASRTALGLFERNTAHHNREYGLRIDDYMDKDGNVKEMMSGYNPRTDSTNSTSPLVLTQLTCFTGYGNGITNAHVRAGELSLSQFRVAKSKSGIVMLRGVRTERYEQKIEDSVILGEREDATVDEDDSDTERRVGLLFTGPVTLKNIYFDDFYKSNVYNSGAIGFAGKNSEAVTQNRMEEGISFGFSDPEQGNRMLKPDTDNDRGGNDVESFRDNGQVTHSSSPTTVLRSTSFHVTDQCYTRENWGPYAICNEDYAMMGISNIVNVKRVSHTDTVVTLDSEGDPVPKNTPFNVVLNRFHYHYVFSFGKDDFDFSRALKLRTSDKKQVIYFDQNLKL
ncbi:cell surface hyaluronidase CEMIP2-like [Argopecten irradians]|uniref:cell surface hyaluronidase CEMIP2-like n=1 Tax=Argopecten irradians TaxID=31199 RepID=UPI00371289F5